MKQASTFLTKAPQEAAGASSKLGLSDDSQSLRFGEALYNHRTERGWSQGYVASAAALSVGYLSELENCRRGAPPRRTVLRLACALGLRAEGTRSLVFYAERERVRGCAGPHLPPKVQDLVALLNLEGYRLPTDLIDLIHTKITEACM